ncbi:MAG: hypothetical protein AB1521_06635 [Bacteroidota bacterium]
MKITCPNCESEDVKMLLPNFYECRDCNRVFSIKPNSQLTIDIDGVRIVPLPSIPRPLKVFESTRPQLSINLHQFGIEKNLLIKKIKSKKALTAASKNIILKNLGLKF